MKRLLFIIVGFGIFLLLALLGLGVVLATQFQPVAAEPQPMQQFVIPKGQAVRTIATRLQEEGLIKQTWAFRLELKRLGSEGDLQAGSFELSPSMSLSQIIQTLTSGSNDIWVTIPEGWRREEVADSLASLDLPDFDKQEFLDLTTDKEGRLFPDTYLVPKLTTATQIASLLEQTFIDKVEEGLAAEIAASEYSLEEAVVMASLVERESRVPTEMREVAGVLWRRIELGMPLQVDATLQYAKGYDRTTQSWWVPPLAADKSIQSPYNTYLNPGLPPQAISSPGVDAIRAALDPATTDALFYIHDSTGQVHFAETLDEHNANIDRYLR